LISKILFSLVKCHHRLPFKTNCWCQPRIDFLHFRNTIITSKNLYFWYQEFNWY